MSLLKLAYPPGGFRNGTEYQSKGRIFDMNLVRWFEGALQPIGGWQEVTDLSDDPITFDEPIRGMLGWRDDNGVMYLAFGGPTKAWGYSVGTLTEITPGDLVDGEETATVVSGGGYGKGIYGAGPYGGVVSDVKNQIVEASSWQFDTFGELLVACHVPTAKIYEWDLDTGNDLTAVTNAPTASAIVVTPERVLVALGADGDRRLLQWSDQDDRTNWTPGTDSFAGDFPLPGSGDLMAGRRGKDETLIWTETDLWRMEFVGGTAIYKVSQAGAQCGLISRHAMGAFGSRAFWMGKHGFFKYDGFVQPLPSEVGDYVFGDFNTVQRSLVTAHTNAEFGEITWFYPSAGATENDRYVTYNWIGNFWMFGTLSRTYAIDRSPNQYPLAVEPTSAGVFTLLEHERGEDYGGLVPFAEGGPVELGQGDQVFSMLYLIPDDKTVGDVEATLFMKFYPDGAETEFGPFTLSEQTSIRQTARQVRLRMTQVNPGWRVGVPRLDVVPGGRR